jgi:hypothetical protein
MYTNVSKVQNRTPVDNETSPPTYEAVVNNKATIIPVHATPPPVIASYIESPDPLDALMTYDSLLIHEKAIVHWDEVSLRMARVYVIL